jgi:hypothetical protein
MKAPPENSNAPVARGVGEAKGIYSDSEFTTLFSFVAILGWAR